MEGWGIQSVSTEKPPAKIADGKTPAYPYRKVCKNRFAKRSVIHVDISSEKREASQSAIPIPSATSPVNI